MFRESVKTFDKTLLIDKNYAGVYFHKGLALAELGRHDDAILAFNKDIDLDAGNTEAFYRKGISLAATGKLGTRLRHSTT